MSDYILNLLPATPEEKAEFEAITPHATHVYAGRTTLTTEMLNQATVIMGWPRPADVASAHNLRWFHSMWAGTDEYVGKIDFPHGCLLSSSAGTNAHAVSEHMLGCLLALYRRIPEARDGQKNHQWVSIGNMKTLLNSTVLVVGAGNIGQRFGKLCQGMGGYTIGVQRTAAPAPDGFHQLHTIDKLDELLPQADVVALCLPQTPETDHIINGHRLSLMKDESVLLNMGRGNAVEQTALIAALESGKLWGAALDVTNPEPLPSDHPLWDAPNLLITPHCAGGMRLELTRKNAICLAQENLRRYLAGDTLINKISM